MEGPTGAHKALQLFIEPTTTSELHLQTAGLAWAQRQGPVLEDAPCPPNLPSRGAQLRGHADTWGGQGPKQQKHAGQGACPPTPWSCPPASSNNGSAEPDGRAA